MFTWLVVHTRELSSTRMLQMVRICLLLSSLEFCVFLINASTAMHTKESRQLRFWFKDSIAETDKPRIAQDFFKALVAPFEFPRDYVGFIKKIMSINYHNKHHLIPFSQ